MSRFSIITQRAPLGKAVLFVSLGLFLGTAHAVPVSTLLFPGELNQLSDNSGETLGVDAGVIGQLEVGDTLRGTLNIDTIEDLSGGSGTNNLGANAVELSAIFEAEVTSANFNNNGADGIFGTIDDIYDFEFGPHVPFAAEHCNSNVGAMACFYEDPTPDYSRTGTIANAETTATDGVLRWVIGMDGSDADEIWTATGPAFPGAAAFVAAGSAVGVFDFQLSTLFESLDVDFEQVLAFNPLDDGLIDVNASGSILGTLGAMSDYDVFNNVDFTVRVVSEPGMLSLLGLGLLGFASIRMRRQS